ncbi:MAG: ORF6N domain-containing protein [bacterium]|nr:ORF6N domain-containing protein [bacterium]
MDLAIVEQENTASKIYEIRGLKVMLDRYLAELYQVETKNLNKAMKRNADKTLRCFCVCSI